MFNENLFWKLVEEKSAAVGESLGLTGSFSRDMYTCKPGRSATLYVSAKPDTYGKRWDDRVAAHDFDTGILWKVAERAVPRHAFETVPVAIMEMAVRSLLGEHIPGFSVNSIEPDGKWEPIAADAVVKFMAEQILPEFERELAALPLKHEPRARLVKVSEDGQTAYFERYDRSQSR